MRVWVDDVRPMPPDFDICIRTVDAAINALRIGGVTHLSLDHDLGEEKTGYDIAKFIEESAYKKRLAPLTVVVHSANPVGRKNIMCAIERAEMFWENKS